MKIHLGCGKRFLPGYTHVDLADYPHIDHNHDIASLPMFADGTAGLIYCCHALEYFDRQQAPAVLAEWRRVLRPGGWLRLAVPDFKALIEVYRRSGGLERVLGPLFGRWPVPGGEAVIYHRTVYDQDSLTALLEACGFTAVRPWDWRQVFTGELAGFDDYSQAYYPHMDKEGGLLISLNLEAQRPEEDRA